MGNVHTDGLVHSIHRAACWTIITYLKPDLKAGLFETTVFPFYFAFQRYQTPLTKTVILLRRTQELAVYRGLDWIVCLCHCVTSVF